MYSTNITFEEGCSATPNIHAGPQINVDNVDKLETTSKFIFCYCCAEKVF